MTVDELKLERDGHLSYGGPDWTEAARLRRMSPGAAEWAIERDADGLPVRMWWRGRRITGESK